MSVNWGILSTAAINDLVIAGVTGSARSQIIAVASRDRDRAEQAASDGGIPTAYGSYDELLADPFVDAIYNPLPNSMHTDWTLRALDAGKHVLVEKPLTRRSDEVGVIAKRAAERGLLVSEAFMWRYNPQTDRLLELIADGAIGKVVFVRAAFSFPLAELRGDDDIRFDAALDGGSLMDVGCYCVSAARLIAGEPIRVAAESQVGSTGVDLAMSGLMRMSSGALAHFDCGFVSRQRDELEVIGETGSLWVDDPWHCREPGISLRRDGQVERFQIPPANSYRLQFEHVSAAIRGEAGLRFGLDDAAGQAVTIEALYRAADEGRAVTL